MEGTGLDTRVAMQPGGICAWGKRSACQGARSLPATRSDNAGARGGLNVRVCGGSDLSKFTLLCLVLPQPFKGL